MKTLEDYKREEKLGITRKNSSRYFEITFAAMIIAAAVHGITGDWRLGFPCFITGLYWFVTNDHDNKILMSCGVYTFVTTILILHFEKGPENKADCGEAIDYFCCLATNKINSNATGIMAAIWFFGIFVVYMSRQHKKIKQQ